MPTTYAGNPANNPDEIQLPSDGDGPGIQAADVGPGFEGLADRTKHLESRIEDLEARWNLVDFQEVSTNAGGLPSVEFQGPATESDSLESLLTASIPTLVGDKVIIEFHGRSSLLFAGSGGVHTKVDSGFEVVQNGTPSFPAGNMRSKTWPFTASTEMFEEATLRVVVTITTPGTFTFNVDWGFGVYNSGDRFRVYQYAATMQIWRQA